MSSLVVSLAAAPVVLWSALKYKLHDPANEQRKVHGRNIPRLGGIAITLGFFAPVVALGFWDNTVSDEVYSDYVRLGGITVLALSAFGLGIADDLRGLAARWRLLGHFAIGAIAWAIGFRIEAISLMGLEMAFPPLVSALLTMLWFAVIINAINLIDGLDGLAGGIVFIVCSAVCVLAVLKGAVFMSLMTAALAGAIMGFLFFNFAPARLFMGDGGSYFLGFTIAALSLDASVKSSTVCILAVPMLALGVPLFDTVYAFMRRALRGIPFSQADKQHIHHRLRDMGFNSRQVVAVLYLVTATGCAIGLAGTLATDSIAIAIVFVYALAVLMATKLCGFRAMGNLFRHCLARYRQRKARFAALHALTDALSTNKSPGEVFTRLAAFGDAMHFRWITVTDTTAGTSRPLYCWSSRNREFADKPVARLALPYGKNGGVRGEIEFAAPECIADALNRDRDYFSAIAWNLGRWAALNAPAPRTQISPPQPELTAAAATAHARR